MTQYETIERHFANWGDTWQEGFVSFFWDVRDETLTSLLRLDSQLAYDIAYSASEAGHDIGAGSALDWMGLNLRGLICAVAESLDDEPYVVIDRGGNGGEKTFASLDEAEMHARGEVDWLVYAKRSVSQRTNGEYYIASGHNTIHSHLWHR